MWKYLFKRLLIAVPTLFGITVITFCIIRLAPGDPTQITLETGHTPYEGSLTRERIEETRRLFGLDKPILFNLDVKDARRSVLAAWEEAVERYRALQSGKTLSEPSVGKKTSPGPPGGRERALEALAEAEADLAAFGRRLIPYMVPVAITLEDEGLFDLLSPILQDGAGIDAAASRDALERWWRNHEPAFTSESIRARIRRLETCPEAQVGAEIEELRSELGDLVLPHAMERLSHLEEGTANLEEGTARRRLIALAAPRAGHRGKLESTTDARRFQAAFERLQRWWRHEGLAFQEIGSFERLKKTFTETQYALWLWRIFHLDFGESFIDFQPVAKKVWAGFKVTLSFQVIVILLIYLISVPLGVFSAVKQDSLGDRLITLFLFMLYSLPNFWLAYLLIFFLGGGDFADLFPIQGLNSEGADKLAFLPWLLDRLWHMCLPLACMTYGGLAVLSRYTRAGMLEVIRQDYIQTARAKGLSERIVIMKHALRNGLIPIVTLIGGLLPTLISGSIIIEYIFGIHGMGWLGYTAVLQRDYPVVMAIAFFSALLVLIGTLLSDLLYVLVDPRIRFEGDA